MYKASLLILIFVLFSGALFSQWQYVNPDTQYSLTFVAIDESSGTCIAGGTEFIRSTDNGLTWTHVPSLNFINATQINDALIVNQSTFLIAEQSNLYSTGLIRRTTDGGTTWSSVASAQHAFIAIASNGTTIIAVGYQGTIKSSSNGGLTWTTVSSGTTANLYSVTWDSAQGKWLIGGEGKRLVSMNANGNSWTTTTVPYNIRDVRYKNGQLVETHTTGTYNGEVVSYDALGAVAAVFPCDNLGLRKAGALPDGRIIGVSNDCFFEANTANGHLFQTTDSLITFYNSIPQGTSVYAIDFGVTYALAVGPIGSLGRYVYSDSLTVFVPATFSTGNTSQYCPGTMFTATATYDYADSYSWELDGTVVSNANILTMPQPTAAGSHSLVLHTTYNNITKSFLLATYTIPPIDFPVYSIGRDSTLCYETGAYFSFHYESGPTQNYNIRLLQNGEPVSPIISAFGSWNTTLSLQSAPLLVSDTVQIQIYSTQSCGLEFVNHDYFFTVGPNLADVTVVSADSGICSTGATLHFALANTVVGASYSLEKISVYNVMPNSAYSNPFTFSNVTGTGMDTMDLNYPSELFYSMALTTPYVHVANEAHDFIRADVSYDGCSAMNVPLFEFDVTDPNAYFSFGHTSTLVGEPIILRNDQLTDHSHWRISPLNEVIVGNINDSVPLLIPQSTGSYAITLVNETRFGCFDSITRLHTVSDTFALENRPVCFASKLPSMNVLGNQVSSQGNYYEYGYYSTCCNGANFAIRKLNPEGVLIWEKRPSYLSSGIVNLMLAMQVDDAENVYAVVKVNNIYLDSIVYTTSTASYKSFLVKWDVNGNMVRMIEENLMSTVTDLVVKNGLVTIISTYSIATFDTNLNLLHSTPIVGYNYTENQFFFGSGGAINEWLWETQHPKLVALPNGQLLVTGDISTSQASIPGIGITLGNISIPAGIHGSTISYAAIYNPLTGFFLSARKIFDGTFQQASVIRDVAIDEDNNPYLLTELWAYGGIDPTAFIYFEDSMLRGPDEGKSFLIKLSSNLETDWIKEASVINGSLTYASGTQKLYISGTILDNFYIGSGENIYQINGKNNTLLTSNSQQYEPFYAVLDKNGSPLSGDMLGKTGSYNNYKVVSTVSPCGDLYISCRPGPSLWLPYAGGSNPPELEINGTVYYADSNYIFKLPASDCVTECSFSEAGGATLPAYCANGPIAIPLYQTYQTDTIAFELLSADTLTQSGYLPVNAGYAIANFQDLTGDHAIVLYSSFSIDTFALHLMQPALPLADDSYDAYCSPELILSAGPAFSAVHWTNAGAGLTGNTAHYTTSDFPDTSSATYEVTALDANHCAVNQSFSIRYTAPSLPLAETSYIANCLDDITIAAAPFFSEVNWSHADTSTSGSSATYTQADYTGQSPVHYEVSAIDTNLCIVQQLFEIVFTTPQTPLSTLQYIISCPDSLLISIDPIFTDVYWTNAGTGITGNSAVYTPDDYILQQPTNYQLIARDANACEVSQTFSISYSSLILPLNYTHYTIACDTDLSLIADTTFTNISWTHLGLETTGNTVSYQAEDLIIGDTVHYEITALYAGICPVEQSFSIYADSCETALSTEISLYPNPVAETLSIVLNTVHSFVQIEIDDLGGMPVLTRTFGSGENLQIPVGELSTGFYLLRIVVDGNTSPVLPFVRGTF